VQQTCWEELLYDQQLPLKMGVWITYQPWPRALRMESEVHVTVRAIFQKGCRAHYSVLSLTSDMSPEVGELDAKETNKGSQVQGSGLRLTTVNTTAICHVFDRGTS
jgi:hypothetical protein